MNYLSLDVGTTCCKCQLFSESGEILFYHSEEYVFKAIDGATYVDIEGIWLRVQNMIALAANRDAVNSVCISSFGESFVLLDENDNILFYPMLYTDMRGGEEAVELEQRYGDEYFVRMGVVPQSLFSVSKLLWIKNHAPKILEKAKKAMLICDYLGYLLTGERVIDYGLASRTGVFHLDSMQFDQEILRELGISPDLFSTPKRAGAVVGKVRGLDNCTLVLGSHDQICACLGAGVLSAGEAVDGLGTVECITAVYDKRNTDVNMGRQGYVCVPYAVEGLYCTYMFNYSCGALTSWFKKKILHDYRGACENFFTYIERGFQDTPTGIFTLPYFAGAATPHRNINARGAFLNLTTETTDSELYQSILECCAMEMRLNTETASAYGIHVKSAVATGGGANSEKWLGLKASIQNIPIQTLRSSEGGLCGCAMLQAAAMTGISLQAAKRVFVRIRGEYLPDENRRNAYEPMYAKYIRLYNALKEFY